MDLKYYVITFSFLIRIKNNKIIFDFDPSKINSQSLANGNINITDITCIVIFQKSNDLTRFINHFIITEKVSKNNVS